MFELAIFHIVEGATTIRYAGIYHSLAMCESAATEERRKFYLNDTAAVYRPWNYKTMCLPADRPKLQKTSDAGVTFRLTLSYTSQDKQDKAVLPTTFRTNYDCVSTGLQLRRSYVEKLVSKEGAPIVSFKCDPVYFQISPSRQQIKQKTIDRT